MRGGVAQLGICCTQVNTCILCLQRPEAVCLVTVDTCSTCALEHYKQSGEERVQSHKSDVANGFYL